MSIISLIGILLVATIIYVYLATKNGKVIEDEVENEVKDVADDIKAEDVKLETDIKTEVKKEI